MGALLTLSPLQALRLNWWVQERARGGIVLSAHVCAGKYDNYDVFTC